MPSPTAAAAVRAVSTAAAAAAAAVSAKEVAEAAAEDGSIPVGEAGAAKSSRCHASAGFVWNFFCFFLT